MEIELFKGETKAIIDPQGAWLTNLSDQSGDILFPRRTLQAPDGSKKIRGGSHVCLPNFGPGGTSGQPQHGFGRTMLWEVAEASDIATTLLLNGGEGDYKMLASTVTYELEDRRLVMTLEVANGGQEKMRVAPAFHPYVALPRGTEMITVDEDKIELEDLHEVRFTKADRLRLQTSQRTIIMESKWLTTWGQWTDQLGSYVCAEPSLDGFTFLNETPQPEELLGAGEVKTYRAAISW